VNNRAKIVNNIKFSTKVSKAYANLTNLRANLTNLYAKLTNLRANVSNPRADFRGLNDKTKGLPVDFQGISGETVLFYLFLPFGFRRFEEVRRWKPEVRSKNSGLRTPGSRL